MTTEICEGCERTVPADQIDGVYCARCRERMDQCKGCGHWFPWEGRKDFSEIDEDSELCIACWNKANPSPEEMAEIKGDMDFHEMMDGEGRHRRRLSRGC